MVGASQQAVWTALASDAAARRSLSGILREEDAPGMFFECAPVSLSTLDQPFEAVILPTRAFEGRATDHRTFAEHLRGPGPDIRVFGNLSGRSTLISPVLTGDFPHFVAFLQSAPAPLVDALWRVTAETVLATLYDPDRDADTPLWVSTHGLGVFWLHVRLDPRPKYIHHRPFHSWPR